MTTSEIQIRYSDIDTLLHVNNISLQYFYDIGKSEYFRDVLGLKGVFGDVGVVAVNNNTTYYKTTLFEEKIIVTTQVKAVGTKSITFYQEIINSDTGEKKSECHSVLVCFNAAEQSGVEVPDGWRESITKHENL